MAKFTITISDEAHPILKEWAKKDERSLTSYLTPIVFFISPSKLNGHLLPINFAGYSLISFVS